MQRFDQAISNESQLATTTQASTPLNFANVVQLVRKSVIEVNQRKRYVVVTGLKESEAVDDVKLFSNLCENELGLKSALQSNGTRRLGKAVGTGPRKLLVKLASEDSALELIKSAKRLTNSSDAYIASKLFINPDLTKE